MRARSFGRRPASSGPRDAGEIRPSAIARFLGFWRIVRRYHALSRLNTSGRSPTIAGNPAAIEASRIASAACSVSETMDGTVAQLPSAPARAPAAPDESPPRAEVGRIGTTHEPGVANQFDLAGRIVCRHGRLAGRAERSGRPGQGQQGDERRHGPDPRRDRSVSARACRRADQSHVTFVWSMPKSLNRKTAATPLNTACIITLAG